jgi:endonuclease/exonuclease/phosphatase family metal-dependent hydrolase
MAATAAGRLREMLVMRLSVLLGLAAGVACASAPRAPSTPVRVLVYNIHAGTDANRVSNLERVAAIIRESRADIVLLQEVDKRTRRSGRIDQLDSLRKLTGMQGVFGKTIDYDGGEYGLGILSRWAILTSVLEPLPVSAPHPGYEARGALVALIEGPLGRIRVIDTHLDASRDVYRTEQATRLATIARDPPTADLVGGDFNSEPDDGVVGILRSAGFGDAYAGCGAMPGLTFPVAVPVKRIDYLMISSSWTCRAATVLASQASDHRAVLFELLYGQKGIASFHIRSSRVGPLL